MATLDFTGASSTITNPTNASNVRIGILEKVGFGLGDFASNLTFGFINLFLLFFFTNVYGLGAADAALIFMLARVLDGVYNLILGQLIDLTHTRFGKLRPYILFGAIPVGVLAILCFTNFSLSSEAKFYYALCSYTGYCLIYSTVNTPYSGLNTIITQDAASRSSLSAYRLSFAYTGYLLVSTSASLIIAQFDSAEDGYFYAIAIFAILAIILFFGCFALTHERVQKELSPEDRKLKLSDIKNVIFKNGPLLQLSLFTLALYQVYTMWMSIAIYYLNYVMAAPEFISVFFLIQALTAIISAIVADPLLRALDKKPTIFMAMTLGVAAALCQYFFIDPQNKVAVMICVIGINAALTIGLVAMWAMLADTVEYAQFKFGIRKEGLIYGFFNCITRVAMAIGGALAAMALALTHYDANNVTPEAIAGINILMTLACAGFFALAALLIAFYPINRSFYQQMITTLQERTSS